MDNDRDLSDLSGLQIGACLFGRYQVWLSVVGFVVVDSSYAKLGINSGNGSGES